MTDAERIAANWGLCPECRNPTRDKVATAPTAGHYIASPGTHVQIHCSRGHYWMVEFGSGPKGTVAVAKSGVVRTEKR